MIFKIKPFLLLLSITYVIGLCAQLNPIDELQVNQYVNWIPDSTEVVPTDSIVVSKVVIGFNQLDPAAIIHVQSGSQENWSDGANETYRIEYLNNSFLIRSSTGNYSAQLIGNKINLIYSATKVDSVSFMFWKVWLEFPNGMTSNAVTYVIS